MKLSVQIVGGFMFRTSLLFKKKTTMENGRQLTDAGFYLM